MTKRANDNPPDPAQQSLADILTNLPAVRAAKKVNTLSRVHRRMIEPYDDSEGARELSFKPTVFCQTSFPYRDPGNGVREWQRTNGNIALQIQAGSVINPNTQKFV